jgi:hypothetical protein
MNYGAVIFARLSGDTIRCELQRQGIESPPGSLDFARPAGA